MIPTPPTLTSENTYKSSFEANQLFAASSSDAMLNDEGPEGLAGTRNRDGT
jgi:hypothetical protein